MVAPVLRPTGNRYGIIQDRFMGFEPLLLPLAILLILEPWANPLTKEISIPL